MDHEQKSDRDWELSDRQLDVFLAVAGTVLLIAGFLALATDRGNVKALFGVMLGTAAIVTVVRSWFHRRKSTDEIDNDLIV